MDRPSYLNFMARRDIFVNLLKRNGIVLAVYTAGMVVFMVFPQLGMAAIWLMLFLMLGLVWANGMLVNHMSRLLAALLTAVITLAVGAGVVLLTIQIQKLFRSTTVRSIFDELQS